MSVTALCVEYASGNLEAMRYTMAGTMPLSTTSLDNEIDKKIYNFILYYS